MALKISVNSEDLVVLLDDSRSMYRRDFGDSNRIDIAIRTISDIIQKKKKEDQSDRYAVVTFNGVVHQQKEMYFNETEILHFIHEKAEFAKGTYLGEALSGALRIIIGELRKIGEKTIRILIISDGITLMSSMNPINIAKVSKELGVIVDAIRLGPAKINGNILKRITEITGGTYYYVSDELELQDAIQRVAKKKERAISTIFGKKDDKSLSSELLSEIAGELLKIEDLTPEQKFKIFQSNPNKKLVCSICYSNKCMVCETNFYGCGRFCPNCLTPVHLHCAMEWADQQNKKNNITNGKYKIFRCVHCFYLLKIPMNNVAISVYDEGNSGEKVALKIPVNGNSDEIFNSVCAHPDCGIVFSDEEDKYIYQCKYCNSYFHEDCFEDYYKKEHKCPNCKKVVEIK